MNDDKDNEREAAETSVTAGKGDRGEEARRNAEARKARAAATLRENLLRRKMQGRARRAGAADETSGLPAAKPGESET